MKGGAPEAAIVTVGEELLSGATVDDNAAWLGRALAVAGLPVRRRWTVGDREDDIVAAVRAARRLADVVVVTGGLGPTRDDRTRPAVASVVGAGLVESPELLEQLRAHLRAQGRETMPPELRALALRPDPGRAFPNPVGAAPGLLFEAEGDGAEMVICLPGVPREMRALFPDIARHLAAVYRGRLRPLVQRVVRTTGIPESEIAPRVEEVVRGHDPEVDVGWHPRATGVDFRLTLAHDGSRDGEVEATRRLDEVEEALAPLLAGYRYDTPTGDLVEGVAERLLALTWRLAVAESCTGGLVAQRWTARPGSSRTLRGGVVAYDNGVKRDLLGVPARILEDEGAVSEPVARIMAESVARLLGAECGIGVTGVAGPGGGSEAKPVGTVWIAATAPALGDEVVTRSRLFHFAGDRDAIREAAAQAALHLLLRLLDDLASGAGFDRSRTGD